MSQVKPPPRIEDLNPAQQALVRALARLPKATSRYGPVQRRSDGTWWEAGVQVAAPTDTDK